VYDYTVAHHTSQYSTVYPLAWWIR